MFGVDEHDPPLAALRMMFESAVLVALLMSEVHAVAAEWRRLAERQTRRWCSRGPRLPSLLMESSRRRKGGDDSCLEQVKFAAVVDVQRLAVVERGLV